MTHQTRRDFLRHSAAAAGAFALGPLAAHSAFGAGATPPDMSIARWSGDPQPEEALGTVATKLAEQALETLGGMGRFVGKGDVVWVKPNIGWDRSAEQAANTNPDLVRTLIRLCYDAGAKKVKVGDYPCNEAKKTYANSGIAEAAKEAGADVVYIDENRFRDADIGGDRIKTLPVYPEIVECDLVISAPIVKHHGMTKVSLCMKNYMGVIGNRRVFHQDLPACIRDLTAYMKPRLSVLDGIRTLTAHGPTGGNLADVKRMDTVAAGVDIVALDAFGSELLGNRPEDVGTVVAGHKAGLGEIDYRKLALEEVAVS